MLFMGRMDKCESLFRKLTATAQQTVNGNSSLRAVTVATKSIKMKTLGDFQKRRYCTAPTVTGQHTQKELKLISCQHEYLEMKMPILIIWQMKMVPNGFLQMKVTRILIQHNTTYQR